MTFRDFLAVIGVGTAGAWAAWIVVLVSIDPMRSGTAGIIFFYLTLAVALFGTIACGGSAIRAWAEPEEISLRHVGKSFRQAVLIVLVVCATMTLSAQGLLVWWTETLVIVCAGIVELAFLCAGRNDRTPV